MDFALMIEGLAVRDQKERALTQMTLGQLIDKLKKLPTTAEVEGIGKPHSYRGYYHDLSFSRGPKKRILASDLLATCQKCMGEVFNGYKGGEYMMGRNTPLWIAPAGSTGVRIMRLKKDGSFETAPEPD